MKSYFNWVVSCLCLTVAICSEAADFTPITLSCDMLQSAPVINLAQRVEIVASGFSVLPPQGERWCYRAIASQGGTFLKMPTFDKGFESLPTSDELAALHIFTAIAISLKGFGNFGTNIQTPDELKAVVNLLISEHYLSQILEGVISAEHRFRLLESNVAVNSALGASCVRFGATVEERGSVQAPGLVFVLNFSRNVVCRHPTAPDSELIWVGFVERYVQGDQPAADTLKGEYEPFVQSLRFMPPR